MRPGNPVFRGQRGYALGAHVRQDGAPPRARHPADGHHPARRGRGAGVDDAGLRQAALDAAGGGRTARARDRPLQGVCPGGQRRPQARGRGDGRRRGAPRPRPASTTVRRAPRRSTRSSGATRGSCRSRWRTTDARWRPDLARPRSTTRRERVLPPLRGTLGEEGAGPTLVATFAFDRRYEQELERAGVVHDGYEKLGSDRDIVYMPAYKAFAGAAGDHGGRDGGPRSVSSRAASRCASSAWRTRSTRWPPATSTCGSR